MEWTQVPVLMYEGLKNIYLNDNMELLVSNPEDHKIISNLFKEPAGIIEDWNFKEFLNEHEK